MFEPDIVSCIPQNVLLLNPLKAHTLEHPASNKAKKNETNSSSRCNPATRSQYLPGKPQKIKLIFILSGHVLLQMVIYSRR